MHMFPKGSPCHVSRYYNVYHRETYQIHFHQRVAVKLQNYEQLLSTSMTEESAMIRRLLGDSSSTILALTPRLAANHSHHVSALLTTYRLLDLELLHDDLRCPPALPSPPSHPNQITPQMVDKVKVKERWKNLNNWQDLLIKFRDCYKGASLGEENLTTIKGSAYRGSLAHLEGLAESHSNQKFTSLVQNFRGAALHWTVLHETAHLGTDRLQAMPQSLSGIVDPDIIRQLNTRYKLHTQQKMDAYLRQHTQGELVLPLHLSLMISPCFLLMPINLVKSKFPRQAVFQVSVSNSLSTYHLKCSIVIMRSGKPETRNSSQS